MAMTKNDIRNALYCGKENENSHMIVFCNSWDYTDFVKYVKRGVDPENIIKDQLLMGKFYQVMEVYNYDIDLDYQLNELRAHHIKTGEINKNMKSIERLEKLPGFNSYKDTGVLKINNLETVSFETIEKVPKGINGYIDRNGSFYPSITISSNVSRYYSRDKITMEQFADAYISTFLNDREAVDRYKRLLESNNQDKRWTPIDFLIDELGYATFCRFIDLDEYGVMEDISRVPKSVTSKQLLVLLTLFAINNTSDTEIVNKGCEYTKMLSKRM